LEIKAMDDFGGGMLAFQQLGYAIELLACAAFACAIAYFGYRIFR
jgi:hypothetical protein